MNKFELFCMIFFALDADWDETKDSTIGEYLSSANPFLFEDIGSADSSIYSDFCNCVSEPKNALDFVLKLFSFLGVLFKG